MRTNSSDGLILYGADGDQSNYLSASLLGGALHVKTEPGPVELLTDPVNDANWHAITITRDRASLTVNVDDMHDYRYNLTQLPLLTPVLGQLNFL